MKEGITCLMHSDAPLFEIKRAIGAFCVQTFERKELFIILGSDSRVNRAVRLYVQLLQRGDIVVAENNSAAIYGRLRTFICLWPPSCLSHPRRLEIQFAYIKDWNCAAVYFTDYILCDRRLRELYWMKGAAVDSLLIDKSSIKAGSLSEYLLELSRPVLSEHRVADTTEEGCFFARLINEWKDEGLQYDLNTILAAAKSTYEMNLKLEVFESCLAEFPFPRPYLVHSKETKLSQV